jgi:hypothetical protein
VTARGTLIFFGGLGAAVAALNIVRREPTDGPFFAFFEERDDFGRVAFRAVVPALEVRERFPPRTEPRRAGVGKTVYKPSKPE